MAARHLLNADGTPFSAEELKLVSTELDRLGDQECTNFRNENASTIASHDAAAILIVAGPGTGKSTLFKQRIVHWLKKNPTAKILALSFVRKLVADLDADIQADKALEKHRKQVDVFTLHKYARSVVEKNRGTKEWQFSPHLRIIVDLWKEIVWQDALFASGESDAEQCSWKNFEKQLHDAEFEESTNWKALKKCYFELCRFYNAAGFPDLIIRATEALAENRKLNEHHFFIIDEYQDFNASEEKFLQQITNETEGKLIVGDDDQVLYETLKSGKASLIRAIYADQSVVNAMLPFCGRCDFHITSAAGHFIKQMADRDAIIKIYLPIGSAGNSKKVQAVACATPAIAVDYIRGFVNRHKNEIEQRKKDLEKGDAKDAYLLILSPSKAVNFYNAKGAKEELLALIKPYSERAREYSDDYYVVLNYYALANYPANNFTLRKVLHHEGVSPEHVAPLLKTCLDKKISFSDLNDEKIKAALAKASSVRSIVDSQASITDKVTKLAAAITISDKAALTCH